MFLHDFFLTVLLISDLMARIKEASIKAAGEVQTESSGNNNFNFIFLPFLHNKTPPQHENACIHV